MTTRIYIDVDGVLNALPVAFGTKELAEATGWESWKSARVNGYVITWAEDLVKELNALAEREDVEFVWVTTWRDMARTEISPALFLKGENWRYLTDGGEATGHLWGMPGRRGWWKLDAVKEDVLTDPVDTIIWIDDDLEMQLNAVEWAHERQITTIAPDLSLGLTRDHVDAIVALVDAIEG